MPQPADMNSPKTAVHELFLPISAQIGMFQYFNETDTLGHFQNFQSWGRWGPCRGLRQPPLSRHPA